jgi:hypothetical protein
VVAMAVHKMLVRDVYRKTGLIPTWPAGEPLRVGQIISRTKTGFLPENSLDNLLPRQSFEVTEDVPSDEQRIIRLSKGVTAELAAAAAALPARMNLNFGAASSYVFVVRGGSVRRYAQVSEVKKAMLKLKEEGRWEDDWQLVWWVRSADSCAVLLSTDKNLSAEVGLRAGIPWDPDQFDLTLLDVDSKMAWQPSNGIASREPHSTPLHKCLRIKGLRSRVSEGNIESAGPGGPEDDYVVDVVDPEQVVGGELEGVH